MYILRIDSSLPDQQVEKPLFVTRIWYLLCVPELTSLWIVDIDILPFWRKSIISTVRSIRFHIFFLQAKYKSIVSIYLTSQQRHDMTILFLHIYIEYMICK